MRRSLIGLFVIALVATACNGAESGTATTPTTTTTITTPTGSGPGPTVVAAAFDPSGVTFAAALERFDRCDAFLDYIKAEALARVGPYGLPGAFSGGRFFFGGDVVAEDSAFAATTVAPASAEFRSDLQAGVDFSGTNVQVAGVDEPDIVKTDGNRILVVTDGKLRYVDVSGDEPQVLDSLRLDDGWDHRLFFRGDRALVFSNGGGVIAEPFAAEVASTFPAFQDGPFLIVYEIDLSDPGDLQVVRKLRLKGNFVAARAVDDTVRLVTTGFPAGLAFVYPSSPGAEDTALAANRAVIENSTLETWLPTFVLSAGDEIVEQGIIADCDRIHRPAEFAGFEMLSVLTLDLAGPLGPGEATTLIARGETVYASTGSLYVATNVWIPTDIEDGPALRELGDRYETALHKFDISGAEPAEYLASGSVDGHLLNQFSLNEFDGRLQVATTAGAPWNFDDDSESFVTIFNQDGDRLAQVGRVGDLGRGERIFSARFVDDVAYVVTFRQVDPFYVVDLSDPAAPRVAGELKIPGYSSYLHPIAGDRVLGVGQDATDEGVTTGAKVSMFDVSDPTAPVELSTWTLSGSYSSAEWDHLAFLYWPPEQMAVLPIQAWEAGFFGAVVLRTEDGLSEFGRISHNPPKEASGTSDCREISPEDLGPRASEFGPDMRVQVCGEDDAGGAVGYYCDIVHPDDLAIIAEEMFGADGSELTDVVGEDERLEICWRDYGESQPPILRSLVIGDDLWTLTPRSLQANGLADLAMRHLITLS